MAPEEVINLFKETGALLEGHFELRSGLHSDRFFQCAHVLAHPRIAERICEAVMAKFREATGGDVDVDSVIAPALGGIIVGHEVARSLNVRSVFAEKQDGRLVMRRFEIKPGEKYIVAEDVITRGGRVQETIDIVEGAGGSVAGIVLIVDRSGGKAVFEYPTVSLVQMTPETWQPAECPLCRKGIPLEHPGS